MAQIDIRPLAVSELRTAGAAFKKSEQVVVNN